MLTPPAMLHAILFASGAPMEKKELAKILGIKESALPVALKALTDSMRDSGVTVIESETEVELRTAPEAAPLIKKLHEAELSRDLGKASIETLAVIAYQPDVTRGDIDWVRGVNSSTSLRTLLMRGLVEGREDEQDKRRIRYSITTEALAHLGVSHIEDLPRYTELSENTKDVVVHESQALAGKETVTE